MQMNFVIRRDRCGEKRMIDDAALKVNLIEGRNA